MSLLKNMLLLSGSGFQTKAIMFNDVSIKTFVDFPPPILDFSDKVEAIVGLDEKEIEIKLVNEEGTQQPISGFLVEVYLSESDGRLTKMDAKDEINPLTGELNKKGFEDYFFIEVDK